MVNDLGIMAQGALEAEDDEAVALEKEGWRQRAEQYCREAVEESEKAVKNKPPTKFRTKAAAWLFATDSQLRSMTGAGWNQFQVENEDAKPMLQWRTMTVTTDQGSDVWAALHYLDCMKVAIMKVPGASHRIPNDVDLALKHCKPKPLVDLLNLVFSTDQGPWGEQRWYYKCLEGATAYVKIADPETCSVFYSMLPKIAGDQLEPPDSHDAQWIEDTFRNLPAVWTQKESKVPGSRWFAFFDRAEQFIPKWHSKLVVIYFVLLQLGLLGSSTYASLLNRGLAPAEGAPATKKALWNYLIMHSVVAPHDKTDVSKQSIKTMHFTLQNVHGNVINLHGAHVSLSLIFQTIEYIFYSILKLCC